MPATPRASRSKAKAAESPAAQPKAPATPRSTTKKAATTPRAKAAVSSPAKSPVAKSPAKIAEQPAPLAALPVVAAEQPRHNVLPAPAVIPAWSWYWLVISSIVVLWDASYCLLRPRSMQGGDLYWIYKPYSLYIAVDKMYGDLKGETVLSFIIIQSWCNLAESALNFLAAYLSKQAGASTRKSLVAGLLALTSLCFTFWKTMIYFAFGREHAKHNTWDMYISLYLLPNGLWILMPFFSMLGVARNIVRLVKRDD
jgi:hypothetical protein